MRLRRGCERLLALFCRGRLERELENEILAHLEMAERDALARGLSPGEARRAARIGFGGIDQVKEEHHDQRSFRWIENLLSDLRYGLACLLRTPGFTAIVVSVLALGIGANVAMFSVVDAVLLKPLPFPQAERIVGVWEAPRPGIVNATSAPDFLDWQRLAAAEFEALSAEQPVSAALTGRDESKRLSGKAVTAEYFRVFGTGALLGRTFTAEDERPGAAPVVVLSHAEWQNDFGGDPDILQRRPMLDGQPHQVVGVLPVGAFDRDETQVLEAAGFYAGPAGARHSLADGMGAAAERGSAGPREPAPASDLCGAGGHAAGGRSRWGYRDRAARAPADR